MILLLLWYYSSLFIYLFELCMFFVCENDVPCYCCLLLPFIIPPFYLKEIQSKYSISVGLKDFFYLTRCSRKVFILFYPRFEYFRLWKKEDSFFKNLLLYTTGCYQLLFSRINDTFCTVFLINDVLFIIAEQLLLWNEQFCFNSLFLFLLLTSF